MTFEITTIEFPSSGTTWNNTTTSWTGSTTKVVIPFMIHHFAGSANWEYVSEFVIRFWISGTIYHVMAMIRINGSGSPYMYLEVRKNYVIQGTTTVKDPLSFDTMYYVKLQANSLSGVAQLYTNQNLSTTTGSTANISHHGSGTFQNKQLAFYLYNQMTGSVSFGRWLDYSVRGVLSRYPDLPISANGMIAYNWDDFNLDDPRITKWTEFESRIPQSKMDKLDYSVGSRLSDTSFNSRVPQAKMDYIDAGISSRLSGTSFESRIPQSKMDLVDAGISSRLSGTDFETRIPQAKMDLIDAGVSTRLSGDSFESRIPQSKMDKLDAGVSSRFSTATWNSSHPASGTYTAGSGGSGASVRPVSGTLGSDLKASIEAWATKIDDAITFPQFNMTLPYPFDGLSSVFNDVGNQLSAGMENISDAMITGVKNLILDVPALLDDIVAKISSSSTFQRLPNWIHSNIQITTLAYWDLSGYISDIATGIGTDMSLPSSVTEPLLGIDIGTSVSFPAATITIPKKLRITLFGNNFDLSLIDFVIPWIPPSVRTKLVPGSKNWPGRTAVSGNRPTFLTDYTGQGVPVSDFLAAIMTYVGSAVILGAIGYYAPGVVYQILKRLLSLASATYLPSLKDAMLAMHPSSNYDSQWNLITPSDNIFSVMGSLNFLTNSDTRLPSIASGKKLATDTDVSSIPTNFLTNDDSRLPTVISGKKLSTDEDIASIPTDFLTTDDSRLPTIASGKKLATDTDVSGIPTNFLTNDDSRLPTVVSGKKLSTDEDIASIPTDFLTTDDPRLPTVASGLTLANSDDMSNIDNDFTTLQSSISGQIGKMYKRLYSTNRIITRHKGVVDDLENWLGSVPSDDISILTPLLDAMLDAEYGTPTETEDSKLNTIVENTESIQVFIQGTPDLALIAQMLARYYR